MPQGEQEFKRWYAEQARRYDMDPNPDSPQQFYDWRAAFRAGAQPDKSLHWPSDFKKPGHPNEIVGGFNTRTGERVPGMPRAKSVEELVSKGWDRDTAIQLMAMPEPSSAQVDYAALAKKYGGSMDAAPAQAPAQASGRVFSTEPKMLRDVQADDAANGEKVGQLIAQHPVLATTILALASGGTAVGRAALKQGASMASRAAGAGKAALSVAAPQIKYELTKQALERVGLPPVVAMPIAMAVSGYKSGAKPAPAAPAPAAAAPAPTAPAPTAPPVAAPAPMRAAGQGPARVVSGATSAASAAPAPPVASPPAVEAPPVPSVAPVSGQSPTQAPAPSAQGPSAMSPQMVRNQLGIYARRAQLALTPEIDAEATALVAQGKTPAQAIAEIQIRTGAGTGTPAGPPAPAPQPVATPPGVGPDEMNEFLRLLKAGKSPEQAIALLKQQRAIAEKLGIPTPAQVRERVARRNIEGRWPDEPTAAKASTANIPPDASERIRVQVTEFPNGPSYSVFPADGGARLFTTRTESALKAWLKRSGYTAEAAQVKK